MPKLMVPDDLIRQCQNRGLEWDRTLASPFGVNARNPFCRAKTSPEIVRPGVMMCARNTLLRQNMSDLLCERGIDICQAKVRF